MKNLGVLKYRIFVSVIGGLFFLVLSLNSQVLRTGIESRDIFIHVFLALFGVAFFVQAYVFSKQLNGENSR